MKHVKEKEESKLVLRLLNWVDERPEWPAFEMEETGVRKVCGQNHAFDFYLITQILRGEEVFLIRVRGFVMMEEESDRCNVPGYEEGDQKPRNKGNLQELGKARKLRFPSNL